MAEKTGRAYVGAIVIDSSNNTLTITQDGTTPETETISAGTYYLQNDGSADDLMEAVASALDGILGERPTMALTFNGDPANPCATVSFTSTVPFALMFGDASNTFPAEALGFADSTNSLALTQASTLTPLRVWVSDQPITVDELGDTTVQENQVVTRSGRVFTNTRGDEIETIQHAFSFNDERRTQTRRATEAGARSAFQQWRVDMRGGLPFFVYEGDYGASEQLTNVTVDRDYVAVPFTFAPARYSPGVPRYSWTMRLRPNV